MLILLTLIGISIIVTIIAFNLNLKGSFLRKILNLRIF